MAALRREEMLSLAQNAVDFAQKKGAAEAEAFIYEGQTTNVGIERGQITKSARVIDKGLGVRVSINKAVGFSYTNIIENGTAIEDAVLKALSAAKASKPDEDWHGLPDKKPLASVQKTYDNKIAELSPEDLVKVASLMLDAAQNTDKRVFPIEGGAGAACISSAVANSNGIAYFDKGTIVECSLAAIGKEGNKVTPVCFEFNAERNYNINPEWVGEETARLAVSALKTKRIETKSTKLVLTQFALQELLYFTLTNAIKADYVQRNQSAFKGKINEKVAAETVTIYDDGLLEDGLRTWTFDAEGIPHQKTPVIERGILRNFLYDDYTAKKEDKESTGNASRAGYLSTPSIDATNLHIVRGNRLPDDITSEVDDGLIIYYLQGAHSSNPISGEFSVVATPAWKIRNGEITHATRGVMLAGNIFEMLKNISAVANNERKLGQLVAPWILVENAKVIGK